MITDQDIRTEVLQALTTDAPDFDIDAIVQDIQATYGPFQSADVLDVDHDAFWTIVAKHATDEDEGCEGHESLNGAAMGATVYCDGSCA